MRSSFDFANVCIERDIRNNENRATNCVARNISKSVDATRKQIEAINKLARNHKLESLPEELRITAGLRLENEDISLSELARLHDPQISKSGLNHRLEKICQAALECDLD
jgi:DNA-binding protein WhiA